MNLRLEPPVFPVLTSMLYSLFRRDIMYMNTVHLQERFMNSISVNQFRAKLKDFVEQVIDRHQPLKRMSEKYKLMPVFLT